MYGDNLSFNEAVTVCIFSIVVVFIVLLVISYVIQLTAAIINKAAAKKNPPASTGDSGNAIAAPVETESAVSGTEESDNVLLAAAAIMAYLGDTSGRFVVRSIHRVVTEESAWSQVGRTGNMQ